MVELTEPLFQRILPMSSGRVLSVTEWGAVDGRPLLWFHGTPGGSRQIPENLRRSLEQYDVRMLVIERPGYGHSTHHVYGQVREVNSDVEIIVEELEIERFCVGGLSGGGPYALAVAHDFAERVPSTVVLGSVVPHTGPNAIEGGAVGVLSPLGSVAAPASRAFGRLLQGLVAVLTPVAEPAFDLATRLFPEGDQKVFDQAEIRAMFIDDTLRQPEGGWPGPALDLNLFVRDWGFDLRDLTGPVHLWHGDADPIVPLAQAEHMARLIPDSSLVVRPAESHLGGFAAADEAVLAAMSHWDD